MKEKLKGIKEDWVECTMGELLEIERGGSPRPIKEYITTDKDGINWIKIGDTKDSKKYITQTLQKIKPSGLHKTRLVYPGDFVLSNSMSFGRPYIMGIKGAIHDGWLVLRDKYKVLDKDFLYNVLSSPIVYNQFSKRAKGSTVKNLNIKIVSDVKINLIPIPEQKAIVKKIEHLFSSLDSGIADLKKAQAQLKIYRQAVLKKAFEGDYPQIKVIDISEVKTGSTPKRGKPQYWDNGTIPWITSGALNNLFVNEPKELITETALKETNCKIIKKGSLLVAMYGEGKTRGKCSELNIDAATNQAIATITLKDEFDNSKLFIKWFFLKNYEEIRLLSSGGVQPNLNLSIIKNTLVPFPSTQEQTEIVRQIEFRLSVCDNVEQSIAESLEKAKALRQSILKKAFEGKLLSTAEIAECKKAKDYEPASVLLQKIKAEQLAQAQLKKKTTKRPKKSKK